MSKYGKTYLLLKACQPDELSDWTRELSIKFMSLGQAIFEIKKAIGLHLQMQMEMNRLVQSNIIHIISFYSG